MPNMFDKFSDKVMTGKIEIKGREDYEAKEPAEYWKDLQDEYEKSRQLVEWLKKEYRENPTPKVDTDGEIQGQYVCFSPEVLEGIADSFGRKEKGAEDPQKVLKGWLRRKIKAGLYDFPDGKNVMTTTEIGGKESICLDMDALVKVDTGDVPKPLASYIMRQKTYGKKKGEITESTLKKIDKLGDVVEANSSDVKSLVNKIK